MSPQPQQQGPQQGQQQETAQSLAEGLLRGPVTIGKRGVEINDTHDAWRFANIAFTSGLAPKGFKNVASVMIAVIMGAELGMTPMASLQNIAVINGRPSLWGDIMLALVRQSGLFDEEVFEETCDDSLDGGTGFCTVRRKPDGKAITRKFSMLDAERAKLLAKDATWHTYPQRMLMFRPRSWALRDAFGDVLLGLRSAEEERDIPDDVPAEEPVSSLEQLTEKLKEPAAVEPDESLNQPTRDPASEPEPAEDPLADRVDHGVRTSPRKPEPEEAEAIAEPEPPYNPPTETEVKEAGNPAISNAERRCEEDRQYREFTQALADADSASEVADLGKKLDEFHEAGLLAGLDYLALKKDIDAVKTRMSQ